MHEHELYIGPPEDKFRVVYCREKEISHVLDLLRDNSFVFLYAAAGNGKTTFGVEMRERIKGTSLILSAQIGKEAFKAVGLYDSGFEASSLIIVDEFGGMFADRKTIDGYLAKGKKFIFMVHSPKKSFTEWRRWHTVRDPLILGLIDDYTNTPWIHLPKWKPNAAN